MTNIFKATREPRYRPSRFPWLGNYGGGQVSSAPPGSPPVIEVFVASTALPGRTPLQATTMLKVVDVATVPHGGAVMPESVPERLPTTISTGRTSTAWRSACNTGREPVHPRGLRKRRQATEARNAKKERIPVFTTGIRNGHDVSRLTP